MKVKNCNHILIDLEFNPTRNRRGLKQEIIEIGAVKLAPDMKVIDRFSALVRPAENFEVAPTIRRLTGIRTADVMNAPSLPDVLDAFFDWVGEEDYRLYSWSGSDETQLLTECRFKELELPELGRWMDLQRLYPRLVGLRRSKPLKLSDVCTANGIFFDRRAAHRALYDAERTADLLAVLVRDAHPGKAPSSFFSSGVVHATSSLDAASGGKLAALLRAMQPELTAEPQPV